jgi:hypothetical protein
MTPVTIEKSSTIAVIHGDDFVRAQGSGATREFWAEVDAYERELRARGLDHVPAGIELP